jgi:peptide/nickel transport system ATP-binding protein
MIDGQDISLLSHREMRPVRRFAQMIFQDPYASLDSRMAIGAAIAEPMVIHGIGNRSERQDRTAELLRRVGLTPDAVKPLSARILRWPAPAHLHCTRTGTRAEADRCR